MFSRGVRKLKGAATKLLSRNQPRAVILCYHRVGKLERDTQLLSVSPENFRKHLEVMVGEYEPVSLAELGTSLRQRKITDKSVVLSFDDGYQDNASTAAKILGRYDVPATVFVTTGLVESGGELMWDALERIMLMPKKLPNHLKIKICGETREWDLSREEDSKTDKRWNVTMDAPLGSRYKAYKDLHILLRPLKYQEQQRVLGELSEWAGIPKDGDVEHRCLRPEELKSLAKNDLIDIGSHTVTHPVLASMTLSEQKEEVSESKDYLEGIIGRPVESFSYPYGGADDADRETVRLVREAGYKLACANVPGAVTRYSDPYWLPRFVVRDWKGEEFSQHLKRWFES